jgi:hypothetical protein
MKNITVIKMDTHLLIWLLNMITPRMICEVEHQLAPLAKIGFLPSGELAQAG